MALHTECSVIFRGNMGTSQADEDIGAIYADIGLSALCISFDTFVASMT